MGYRDIINEIREMSPLKRRFTAAAIGFGAGVMPFPILAFGLAVAGGMVLSEISDGEPGLDKFKRADYWKNFGSFFAGVVVGSVLFSMAENITSGEQAYLDETQTAILVDGSGVLVEQPQIQPPTIS